MNFISHPSRQFVTALVIVAFLALALFSFAVMMRGADGNMQGDCPFSAMGASLCPQDTLAVVTHHIDAYQSFLNVSGSSGFAVLIIALFFALGAFLSGMARPLPARVRIRRHFYYSLPRVPQAAHISHWLSLFEHSPSF